LPSLSWALRSLLISGQSVGVRLLRIWHNLGRLCQHTLAGLIRALKSALTSGRLVGSLLHRIWHRLGHRNQHWLINIVIGFAIWIVLHFAHDRRIVVAAQNWALDTAMQGNAAVRTQRSDPVALQDLAFIDVDEETWRDPQWGNSEPFRAPRDGLLALVDYAIKQKVRYIVLDVIIEGKNDPEDAQLAKKDPAAAQLAKQDAQFAKQIEQRAALLNSDQHILFVRTLRKPLNGMQDRLAPELRASPLDEVIKTHPNQFQSVAPYFRVSRDGVLRDWQMWQTGCRRDAPGKGVGHWEILPSVQLAIAALMQSDKMSDPKRRDYRAAFPWNNPVEKHRCIVDLASYNQPDIPASTFGPDDARMWDWLPKSRLPHASEVEKPSDAIIALTNRIFFRFRYRQEPSPVLLIPALAILKHTPHRDVVENSSVVVIGQSFEAAGDLHATPIGIMPGPMVLINSLESMLKPGLLQEPGRTEHWAIECALIVLVGCAFAYLDHLIAFIVLLTLFVPLLIILNYVLLLHGIWMDFAIPLLGMYMHKIIAEFEAYGPRRREHRHLRSTHVHTDKEDTDAID
jgi:CHASE2 domain-containing sensor protein